MVLVCRNSSIVAVVRSVVVVVKGKKRKEDMEQRRRLCSYLRISAVWQTRTESVS
jgi:hypothetical protein